MTKEEIEVVVSEETTKEEQTETPKDNTGQESATNELEVKNDNKKKQTKQLKKSKKTKKPVDVVPRGMPKSNRPWKTPKTKFITMKKKLNHNSFAKKEELRNELRRIKELSKELKDQRKEERVQKHQRRIENAERRLANERRSELVQIIKNPAKLKRLKKKQLRMIEKRDISQVKTV